MAKKKVGELIKEARTNAGLTQEKLAKSIKGLEASDISKAERGEKDLTQEQLKAIAKATGVTQKSLLDAAAGSKPAAKTTAAKTTASKTAASRTTASRSSSKTTAAKSTSSTSSMKVSATEKKLVELYRNADSDTKKKVMDLLKGKEPEGGDLINSLLGSALGQILK